MGRNFNRQENLKRSKMKRQYALDRPEMLRPSAPRVQQSGAFAMAAKAEDPETRRMIDEFLAKKRGQP